MRNKAGLMTYNNSYILGHLKSYDLEKLKWHGHGCSKQKIFLGSWARKQGEKNIKVSPSSLLVLRLAQEEADRNG